MPTTATAKEDTDALEAGRKYEVLNITKHAVFILLGKATGWFRRDLFVIS